MTELMEEEDVRDGEPQPDYTDEPEIIAARTRSRTRIDPTRKSKKAEGCGSPGCAKGTQKGIPFDRQPWDFRVFKYVNQALVIVSKQRPDSAGFYSAFRLLVGLVMLWAWKKVLWNVWEAVATTFSRKISEDQIAERIPICGTCEERTERKRWFSGSKDAYCGACECPDYFLTRLYKVGEDGEPNRPGFKIGRKRMNCPIGALPGSIKMKTGTAEQRGNEGGEDDVDGGLDRND